MMSFATQAQDEVLYDISTTPATEVVVGHIYVLQNRAYPDYGLIYDSNQGFATTFEPVSEQLGQSVTSDQPFLFTATADGITLPVTLININDNGEMGYGNAGGGQVLSPRRNAAASDETTYFTVKDQDGQLAMLTYNVEDEYCDLYGVIYGGENTTPAECAQWIAYEVTEHEHQWEYSDSNVHFCTCGKYAVHELDGCSCTVCQSEVHEFDYENYPLTCTRCGESCHHPRIDHIEAKEPNCYSDGWKEHYECRVCGDVFKDEAGNEPYPYDDCCSYATGHDIDADLHCTRCDAQLIVEGELTNGESVDITMTMTDYDQFSNPAASPLYSFETETSNMLFNVSVSADVTDGRVSVFDKDFQFVDTRWLTDPYMDLEEASTYYAMFYYHGGEEEDTTMDCVATLSLEGGDCIHEWVVSYDEDGHSHFHHCTKCDAEDRHYVTGENGVCVCGYKCTEHSYYVDGLASVKATENADGQYIVVKICEYCQHEKTETVDPDGECPEGDNHSWVDDGTINATCTAKGYTYHICKKCAMLYVADFTPVDPDNHEWAVEEQWNEEELVSMHFCCNGCEAYGNLEEHTMVDGKCIVCGYKECQHTDCESVDNGGHICKECDGYFPHSIGEDGECVCGFECTKHRFYALAIASVEATENINDGEIYVVEECEYCHVQGEPKVVDTKSECTESKNHNHFWVRYTTDVMPTTEEGGIAKISCWYCDESYFVRVPADRDACTEYWGHNWYESEGKIVCQDCGKTITPTILKMGENAGIGVDASVCHYFWDPSTAPLYKFVPENSGPYNFKIKDNASADCKVFIFETNEDDHLDMNIQDGEYYALEAGKNYYLQFLTTDVDGDRNPIAYEDATIVVSESTQLVIAAAADASGDSKPVVIAKDEETGKWATTQNIVLTDGVESFSTPVDFTAPQVDYKRLMPNSQWGTLCLPFDITVDAAGKPYDFYELTSATSTEVTLTKVADGTLRANTPVIVRRNASETGVHFTETDVIVKTNRGYSDGEEKDGLQMIGVFTPYELYGGSYYLDAVDGKLYDTGAYYNETGDPFKVNAYRCYFDVVGRHDEARALNINFEEEEVSSIEAIDALTSGKAEFYDLQGRERSELQSGLNVLRYGNGKSVKVIIK